MACLFFVLTGNQIFITTTCS